MLRVWSLVVVVGACGCGGDTTGVTAGAICGGEVGRACASSEYCAYEPPARCGHADATARCKARPEVCPEIYAPVCGCDAKTYPSACEAARAGKGYGAEGPCPGEPDASTPAWAVCGGPGECVALVPGCCGICGAPTLDDVRGVNVDRTEDFRAATCDDPDPLCPGCATQLEPNLMGFCDSGRCQAHDIRKEDLSACAVDSDCVLRDAACCSACDVDPHALVALAATRVGTYTGLVCRPETACLACEPILPEGWAAVCGESKHCEVAQRTNLCPRDPPAHGAACTLAPGLVCEYGDDIRPGCRTHATCGATWSLAVSGCPPLPGPGEGGCPAAPPAPGASCGDDGLLCDLGGDSLCACASCLGPCSQFPVWSCGGPPSTPGCPARAPLLGAPCDSPDLVCTYGVMCHSIASAGRRCADGAWIEEPLLCPA